MNRNRLRPSADFSVRSGANARAQVDRAGASSGGGDEQPDYNKFSRPRGLALPPRVSHRLPAVFVDRANLLTMDSRSHCLMRCAGVALAGAALAIAATATAADSPTIPTSDGSEFFEKTIRPLLVAECLECHGEKKKGGLRLDSRASMLEGGDSGPAITPGDPASSPLVHAVRYDDDPKMPPDGKLADESIAALTAWIQMGAPWPDDASAASKGGLSRQAWKSHWAFQPVADPPLPAVERRDWPRQPIDYFILAELERRKLAPSPEADRRTLARRASFDVIGLSPSAEEIERFVADPSPDAYPRLVERLLASPQYGARWARHWLDIARYADTKGYLFTQDRRYPNAYRYRDWVIQSLNGDLPYDEFLVDQIAADRLASDGDPSRLAAMGFLTVGRRFLNNPHDIIDDRLDVLMRGTMALTVTCARCHDHKYDPIPTRDYYSLYGVLASSTEPAEPADLMTLADARQPVVPHVFERGNSGNPGEAVPRQFLSIVAGENRQPFGPGSGRLELARAIVAPDNPLTARVIANRVWMYYFDAPLVRTPSDFGMRSQPPSHPQLLDHLAASLVRNGWSLKSLHRAILSSAAYRQSSLDRAEARAADPENRLLWRMNRKRLDFEAMRDALLAAGGHLDLAIGGPSVELTTTPWTPRRTVFGLIDRQNLPSLFRTFDFASPDTHSPARFATTVPQQSLFMMNSPFVIDQVRNLASRTERAAAEPRERIEQAYRLALSRMPSKEETALGLEFLANEPSRGGDAASVSSSLSPWERYLQVVLLSNEFMYVD
jgi:hypothetical protein